AKKEATDGAKPSKVIAKVNGAAIREDDLAVRLHGTRSSTNTKPDRLDDIITDELLYQQGFKLGLDKNPDYQVQIAKLERQLSDMKRSTMRRLVYNSQVASKINITDQAVKNYYDKNLSQITTEYHLGLIWINNKEQAEGILKKIQSGVAFESVARTVMGEKATAGRKPWDMGFRSWGEIPPAYLDTVCKLKPGEVSGILTFPQSGYPIFKLLEARKNPKADFENMSGAIMSRLRDKKVAEAYEQYVEKLKKDAKIEKF
ncbi:MAG: peptidyl-prolyl cis-trans isomerase, partial [Syntrophales bacterium]|nr:peptidyl-prolyl cis-trans isomerase [Syntrophales bacterium]